MIQCRKYDIVPVLTSIAQSAVKEKVIRVIVSTFRVASFGEEFVATKMANALHRT